MKTAIRTIVCRFQNKNELMEHLRQPTRQAAPSAVTFLGDFEARPGEQLKLIFVVEDGSQRPPQCGARVSLATCSRAPRAMRASQHPLWHYTADIADEDRVWLKMFLTKLRTMDRFQLQMAS